MKQTFPIVVLGFLMACGGSPTRPTPMSATQSTAQKSSEPPAPAPAPAPAPTPSPDPGPTPTPAPTPTPTPAPAPAKTVLHATVSTSHWYPGASFTLPQSFDLVIEGRTVKIYTLDPLPFSFYRSNDDFLVRTSDFELVVQGGAFTFNGLSGQASGSVSGGQ